MLAQAVAARNKAHILAHPAPPDTHNRACLDPLVPPPPAPTEFSMSYAQKHHAGNPDIAAAVQLEIQSVTEIFDVLRPIAYKDIEPSAEKLSSNMRGKQKRDGRTTARLTGNGSRQSSESFDSTYAGTSDLASLACLISAFFAQAVADDTLDQLVHADFDLPKAFLQCRLPRSATNGKQIVIKMQDNLPHPLAGQWMEVVGCLYGLKQSNAVFAADFTQTLAGAGFHPITLPGFLTTPVDNQIFGKLDPTNPKRKTIVCMVVDDGQILSTAPEYLADLKSALDARYGRHGPITYNAVTTQHCGVRITRAPHGAVTLDLESHILKMLHTLGAAHLPGALTPSNPDLFEPSNDTTPTPETPYRQITGCLNFTTRVRPDILKETRHASGANACPTVDDLRKVTQTLRHLKAFPAKGCTYYTKDGPTLTATVDASHAVHADGKSQTGYYLSIGATNAPFYAHAGKQSSCVAVGPCEAEYVALTACAKSVLRFRCLLEACGFPQPHPTVIREDALSAINLAQAPQVPRKSKHIHMRHHFIRHLVSEGVVRLQHIRTGVMTADLLTKPHGPASHSYHSHQLLNTASCLSP